MKDIKITTLEKLAIANRTPDKMPLNPTAQGWTGSKIREEIGVAILMLLDLLEDKLIDTYDNFMAINDIKVVESFNNLTETGVYKCGNDIIFYSNNFQLGFVDSKLVYKEFINGMWVSSGNVFEPANANIQGHIARKDNPHEISAGQIGAATASHNHDSAYIKQAELGVSIATLDTGGLVPVSQLPSYVYVSAVIEQPTVNDFPLVGETNKIYVAQNTNLTYRWSGSQYVEISKSLAIGETSETAYRGDRGKTAYEHSQASGNPHNATANEVAYNETATVKQELDSKAITFARNITIATTDWVDHTSGKKAVISVSDVVASDTPIVSLDCSESEEVNATRLEYAKIYNAETGAGTITFYATEALSEAVKIQIKVVR